MGLMMECNHGNCQLDCSIATDQQGNLPDMVPLPALFRFYIYGIQGFCNEIFFTALFDFFINGTGSWQLKGHSAISTFFIYGMCSIMLERLYIFLHHKHGVRLYVRMPLYMLIGYTWEFSCGMILRQFNACPWDYSNYRFNVMGLITLEYAPGWLLIAYLQDILGEYLTNVQVPHQSLALAGFKLD